VALANYLKDDGEWRDYSTKEHKDDPVKRMIYFLSKPWKWQEEWENFEKTKELTRSN
jgi:hypothetical protein